MLTFRARTLALFFGLAAGSAACADDDVPRPGPAAPTSGTGGAPASVLIPGLSAPVTAVTDPNGLLHLQCAADNDCFAALGYFHAANRMFFMDFVRNLVRGSLGRLVKAGDTVLERDYENRSFFCTREGEPLEQKLYDDASDLVKGHFDAYAKGVNAWLGDMRAGKNGATLTTEYDFALVVKENIRGWEPADSAAIGLYVLNDLSNNSGGELSLAERYPAFDPVLAPDLFSVRPVFDAFTMTASSSMLAPRSPAASDDAGARIAPLTALLAAGSRRMKAIGGGSRGDGLGEIGSNNWAVGPSRTSAGHALVANDPHLSLTNPSIWFGVELDGKSAGTGDYHVAGSTFPGLPSVMVGHNESIGWGVTTAYYDLADEYVEELTPDHKSVMFEGAPVAIFEKEFTFEDASTGKPVKKTFRWVPHHGPIVSEDDTKNTAISVRWTAHDGGTDLDAFFALARAASVADAKKGLESATSANQNFVIVDKDGSIGWYPYGKLPNRPWASPALPPWMPLPGDGSAEWQGVVPLASLPQLTDPPAGFIATANQDMTGASADGDITNDGQAALQAWDKADGTREQRIVDLIAAGGNAHSVKTMQAIQGDTYSLYGSIVVPAVLAAAGTATLSAEEQDLIDALTAWKLSCPTGLDETDPLADPAKAPKDADPDIASESIGCTAFHTTLFAILKEALGDEEDAAGQPLGGLSLQIVARALSDPSSFASGDKLWDDVATMAVIETRDEILVRAIQDAAAVLSKSLGAPDEWRWGRVHTLTLRSIYDNFGVATYNEGPYAAPGGQYTVNVANPRSRSLPTDGSAPDFGFAAGPSVRFVVEASPEGISMSYELPGGQDLHRESPFYNSLLSKWLVNEPVSFPFGPGAVKEPASTIVLGPAP